MPITLKSYFTTAIYGVWSDVSYCRMFLGINCSRHFSSINLKLSALIWQLNNCGAGDKLYLLTLSY